MKVLYKEMGTFSAAICKSIPKKRTLLWVSSAQVAKLYLQWKCVSLLQKHFQDQTVTVSLVHGQ